VSAPVGQHWPVPAFPEKGLQVQAAARFGRMLANMKTKKWAEHGSIESLELEKMKKMKKKIEKNEENEK
jgi:hypothetical protein